MYNFADWRSWTILFALSICTFDSGLSSDGLSDVGGVDSIVRLCIRGDGWMEERNGWMTCSRAWFWRVQRSTRIVGKPPPQQPILTEPKLPSLPSPPPPRLPPPHHHCRPSRSMATARISIVGRLRPRIQGEIDDDTVQAQRDEDGKSYFTVVHPRDNSQRFKFPSVPQIVFKLSS